MSEKIPIAEYISLLYLGVLVLVISAFWFCFSFLWVLVWEEKTSLVFIWKYRAYGIGVLSGPNLSFIPMKFCIVVVCLFRNACLSVSSARFLGRVCGWVLSAFWGFSRCVPVSFDTFLNFFSSFFGVRFRSVKSIFYSILLGGFGGNSYLCKDFPLKIFLENIWWERKKYLPLQPQTRNKRPSRWGKRFSRKRMKKEFFERFT